MLIDDRASFPPVIGGGNVMTRTGDRTLFTVR
jgi:hypothetical protein